MVIPLHPHQIYYQYLLILVGSDFSNTSDRCRLNKTYPDVLIISISRYYRSFYELKLRLLPSVYLSYFWIHQMDLISTL